MTPWNWFWAGTADVFEDISLLLVESSPLISYRERKRFRDLVERQRAIRQRSLRP